MMEDLVIDPMSGKYSRSNSSELIKLTEKIGKCYKCKNTLIVTSGMNAIHTSILSIMMSKSWKSFNLVYGSELYCDTPRLFRFISEQFVKLNLYECDVTNDDILRCFKTKINNQDNVLFIESCSNPNGNIFDFDQLKELRKLSKSLIVIIDNTWLSSAIFNPFDVGADIVVTSLTKYYSAGNAIGGAIMFRDENLYKTAESHNRITGVHISPHNAKIISNNVDTLQTRITRGSEITLKIINQLEKNNKILKISHSSLPSDKNYPLGKKYFKTNLFPNVFTFDVRGNKREVLHILSTNKTINHITSFGAEMSRTDPWPKEEKGIVTIRLSVGFNDDSDRVVRGINEILSNM